MFSGPLRSLGVAIGADGSVYCAGQTGGGITTDADIVAVKYSSEGDELWTYRYDHPYDGLDRGTDIAVDGAGNAYISGYSQVGLSEYHFTTISLDASGAERWITTVESPDGLGWNIALTEDGDAIVAGYDAFRFSTIRYDGATGEVEWNRTYSLGFGAQAFDLAIDDAGDIYVTGSVGTGASGLELDWATVKYGPDGDLLWQHQYDGPDQTIDEGAAVAIDEVNARVLLAGYSTGIGSSADITTLSLDAATGNQLWVARANGPQDGLDTGDDVVVDGLGNVYVVGTWVAAAGGVRRQVLLGYDMEGEERLLETLGVGGSYYGDQVRLPASGGPVFTSGSAAGDYSVARFDSDNPAEVGTTNLSASMLRVFPAVPTPFNSETRLRFELSEAADIKIEVFDAAGRLVRTLASGTQGAGSHSMVWNGQDDHGRSLTPGVYYSRVQAGPHSQSGRVVLSR